MSATGSSSPSKPESFGALASLSAESRPGEKRPEASHDSSSPQNSREGAVELPAAPPKVATEAVHGAPLRQMMGGLGEFPCRVALQSEYTHLLLAAAEI